MSTVLNRSARRFAPWLSLVVVYLVLGFASRLILWAKFGLDADVSALSLPFLMFAGLLNDFAESLYLFAPFALYILLLPDRWFRMWWNRAAIHTGTLLCIVGLLYLSATEYFFFEEFDARFNLVAFDYLAFPGEVFTDIWEAYPVVQVLLAAITLGVLITYAVRPWLEAGYAVTVPQSCITRPTRFHCRQTASRTNCCRTATAASFWRPVPATSTTSRIT